MSARTAPAWRTFQPVRAQSRKATEAYDYCQPIDREEKVKRLTAFDAYAQRERVRRRGNKGWSTKGPLGFAAVALGRLLIRFAADVTRSGRRVLAPSRDYLAGVLGIDIKTVDRAKAELRAHGWLDWIRRFEPVEDPGGEGPQIRQIPNAYRLLIPAAAALLLGFRGMAAPTSADIASLAEQRAEADATAKAYGRDQFSDRLDASAARRAAARAGENPAMSAEDKTSCNRGDNH